MKTTGVVRRIDDLGSIVIPKEIRKTLRIKDGESVEIFLNSDNIVLKKYSPLEGLPDFYKDYVDSIYSEIGNNIVIVDRDKIVAVSGELKKKYFNKSISSIVETYHTLERLLTGKGNVKTDIGGPVTIVRVSNEVVKSGIWNLIYFTGFITIQLAIMNLLPFPALDGGWILMILIELISRKKLPEKAVELINTIGFMILMAFMVFVMIKDILFPIKL